MLKIEQMGNKDDKKQVTDFAKLDLSKKQMLSTFITNMASTLMQSQQQQQQQKQNGGVTSGQKTKG